MKRLPLLAVSAISLGCVTEQQEGRLFSLKDGHVAPLVVHDARSASGKIVGSLPTGEPCSGEFTTVPDGEPLVGLSESPALGRNAERSVVVLACGPGHVLRCVLGRRQGEGFSYGGCKDQQGVEYALMF